MKTYKQLQEDFRNILPNDNGSKLKRLDYSSHKCKESEGKMILIEIDKFGITRCGYCHEIVKYKLKEK